MALCAPKPLASKRAGAEVVLYNPDEKPAFRSRRLSVDEAAPGTELSNPSGRCPLCRQSVDARFAFAAQAYFDLLQGRETWLKHAEAKFLEGESVSFWRVWCQKWDERGDLKSCYVSRVRRDKRGGRVYGSWKIAGLFRSGGRDSAQDANIMSSLQDLFVL